MGRHRRLPSTEPRGRADPPCGYSLIEVVVAMFLASIMITSLFGVTLTSKASGGKNDRRLLASQAARQVTGRLRNFVTGCNCSVTTGVCDPASCTLQGPTPRPGVESWYFNCPACSPPVNDSMGEKYALTLGEHVIAGLLPASFEAAPYGARVRYTVTTPQASIDNRPVPAVTVNVTWTEP